jgi:hypothetical protein
MPANFFSLPGELRNKVYHYLLVRGEPIDPWYGDHELALNLLCVNKTIQHEANSLLYAQNYFDFTASNSERIARFLNRIGRNNASYIQYICIDFPNIRDLEDDINFEDDSASILAKIQSDCTNLMTLITSPESTYAMEGKLDAL